MKIGIIGDPHFGASFSIGKTDPKTQLNTRLIDFSKTFNRVIDSFNERGVSVVVITGDIFDTKHPTSSQQNIFTKCARRANTLGMQVLMVVGNHDQQRAISTTTVDIYDSLDLQDIKVFQDIATYTVKDGYGNDVNLVFMPYKDRRMLGVQSSYEAIDMIRADLAKQISGLQGKKIVVGHFMVDKPVAAGDGESFSANELVLPCSVFDGADAVVMGHVHKHDIIRKNDPLIMYCGSMEKISFGERGHRKVSIVLDTDDLSMSEIIHTKTRKLHEINLNYVNDKQQYGGLITKKIIIDIDRFHMRYGLDSAIVRLNVRTCEDDVYHVDQRMIKEHILSKKVKNLVGVHVSSNTSRKLRDKNITETVDCKKAMTAFIKSLSEEDNTKKKLLKAASAIIEEVDGK